MNSQEREQLNSFLSQLVGARLNQKDAEAESLIAEAVSRQPDATYLLVQKAFLMEQAVKNAQNRINQLQAEVESLRAAAPQPRGSFVDGNSWGNAGLRPQAAMPSSPLMASAPAPAASASSWGSGWLGNVATTAAGVVAGSFLFQGIEHLMGHHDNGGGLLGGNALSATPNEATVINNYFDSDNSGGSDFTQASLDDSGSGDDDPSWL